MTVVINMHKLHIQDMSCHDYEGVMSVLCTPHKSKVLPNYDRIYMFL